MYRYDVACLQPTSRIRCYQRSGNLLSRTTRSCHLYQSQPGIPGRLERFQGISSSEHGRQDAADSKKVKVSRGIPKTVRRGAVHVVDRRSETEQATTDAGVSARILEGTGAGDCRCRRNSTRPSWLSVVCSPLYRHIPQ
jgi:hypothetical protein